MSRLKLYYPETESQDARFDFTPGVVTHDLRESEDVVSIPMHSRFKLPAGGNSMIDLLIRAQQIRANRCCPQCDHPVVTPVELEDGVVNRTGMVIPGTATLVGFHCESCDLDWSV